MKCDSRKPERAVGCTGLLDGSWTRNRIAHAIACELDRAYQKHGREQWGRHEFYGILKEEVDELWDTIKTDAPEEQVAAEAIQVAAMVFRYLETGDRYGYPPKRKPEMPVCSPSLLAELITEELFTECGGAKAVRLVMETDKQLSGSGWCRGAVRDIIKRHLNAKQGK